MSATTFNSASWLEQAEKADIIDLSSPFEKGMPMHFAHPPFHITLNNRHGDVVRPCGHSSSNEMIVTSCHASTHIDALCHVSDHGKLFGGHDAQEQQRGTGLFKVLGVETIKPIFKRGILLDVPRALGVEALEPAYEITPEDLEKAEKLTGATIQKGDIALVRTGWAQFWKQPAKFLGSDSAGAPGPGVPAGEWLAARKPFAVGSDTSAFEVMNHKNITLEVHVVLIARNGIHIMENLNLEELAARAPSCFSFVAVPLRITGATGSPIRPLALL